MMRPIHVRMARAALNWTLNDLGERASVNKNTISKYEAGGSVMSDALQRIEKVLRDAGVQFIDEETEHGAIVRVSPARGKPTSQRGVRR